jgi:hypothetical protein
MIFLLLMVLGNLIIIDYWKRKHYSYWKWNFIGDCDNDDYDNDDDYDGNDGAYDDDEGIGNFFRLNPLKSPVIPEASIFCWLICSFDCFSPCLMFQWIRIGLLQVGQPSPLTFDDFYPVV